MGRLLAFAPNVRGHLLTLLDIEAKIDAQLDTISNLLDAAAGELGFSGEAFRKLMCTFDATREVFSKEAAEVCQQVDECNGQIRTLIEQQREQRKAAATALGLTDEQLYKLLETTREQS